MLGRFEKPSAEVSEKIGAMCAILIDEFLEEVLPIWLRGCIGLAFQTGLRGRRCNLPLGLCDY